MFTPAPEPRASIWMLIGLFALGAFLIQPVPGSLRWLPEAVPAEVADQPESAPRAVLKARRSAFWLSFTARTNKSSAYFHALTLPIESSADFMLVHLS